MANDPVNYVDAGGESLSVALIGVPFWPLAPLLLPTAPQIAVLVVAGGVAYLTYEIYDYFNSPEQCGLESRSRSGGIKGERGKERKNPNPNKEKSRDHQTGKKLPKKNNPKPPVILPELIGK